MSQREQYVSIHYIKLKNEAVLCRKNENDLRGEPTPPTPDRRGYQNIKMSKYKIAKEGVFPLNKEIIGINIYSAKLQR